MDNQNNKRSPLDEIKQVTRNAASRKNNDSQKSESENSTPNPSPSSRNVRRVPPVKNNNADLASEQKQTPVQQKKPTQNSTSSKFPDLTHPSSPDKKPLTDDFDIEIPNISRKPSTQQNQLSRAEKVRMARQSAVRARDEANHTRIVDMESLSPEEKRQLELQREEAHRLVQENTAKFDKSQTRITDTIPAQTKRKNPKKSSSKSNDISEEFEEAVGKGVLSGTIKAVIYIVSVLVVSICLSLFVIFVGNDCFAFVKNDANVTITLPEDPTLSDIARELHKNKVIKYPNIFKLYVSLRSKGDSDYLSGEFTVNGTMSYSSLIAEFRPSRTRKEVTITIVEGSTTDEIIELFLSKGIGTREGFVDAIQNYNFDFWFLEGIDEQKAANRTYRLDGYLFPDTYNFFTDSSEKDVIYKLLSNFEAKFDRENEARAKELGMSVDDIVVMASMIQKEAKFVADYPLVSSVFHNRLNSNSTGHKLESNATVQYTMPKDEVSINLSYDQIQKYDTKYNTFLYEGLPVGPICNSSLNALNWAMYPENTNYLYFVSDKEGNNRYATSYSAHLKNVADIDAGN